MTVTNNRNRLREQRSIQFAKVWWSGCVTWRGWRISIAERERKTREPKIRIKTHSTHILNALDNCHKINWSLTNRQSLRCHFRISVVRQRDYDEKASQRIRSHCSSCFLACALILMVLPHHCFSSVSHYKLKVSRHLFVVSMNKQKMIVLNLTEQRHEQICCNAKKGENKSNLKTRTRQMQSSSVPTMMMVVVHSHWKMERFMPRRALRAATKENGKQNLKQNYSYIIEWK